MRVRRTSEPALALCLLLLAVTARFLPHPANFAPITAVALFAGVYLRTWYAFLVPLAAMIASDAVIGFHNLIAVTWGSFLLSGLIGWRLRRHRRPGALLLGTLAASVQFFLITNAAVWQFGTLYEHSWSGLLLSYTYALPFFRNTLLGDLFYTAALVGLYEALRYLLRRRARIRIRYDQTA